MVFIYSLRPYSFVQKKEKFWDFVVQKKIPLPLWTQLYAFGLTPPPPSFCVRTTWMTPIENYLLVYKLLEFAVEPILVIRNKAVSANIFSPKNHVYYRNHC